MKRFILFLFVISLFASCEIQTTENRIPKISSFYISNIDKTTHQLHGYDIERGKYVVTGSEYMLVTNLLKRTFKSGGDITEKDSISLYYKYYDNDSTGVVGVEVK